MGLSKYSFQHTIGVNLQEKKEIGTGGKISFL